MVAMIATVAKGVMKGGIRPQAQMKDILWIR